MDKSGNKPLVYHSGSKYMYAGDYKVSIMYLIISPDGAEKVDMITRHQLYELIIKDMQSEIDGTSTHVETSVI